MADVKLVAYEASHLLEMKLRDTLISNQELVDKLAVLFKQPGSFVATVLADKKPIAVYGWHLLHPGVAEAWACMSDDVQKYPKSFHRLSLNLLKVAFGSMKIHRMQSIVLKNYSVGQRWLEGLGFQLEGTMRAHSMDAKDCLLYARVK